ncbi:class I SAM-dependent methyltransferase [Baekduia sp. Peel2402]|uniref:class I SAM-dependent methyltransferase n=1 Tax=Baekduia sp. Peel2402 TaxID=3458296 RepID=UPI00403EDE2F
MTESASLRAHAAVPFMNPLSEADVDGAIAGLELPAGARVVETGCGAAVLLRRVLAAHPGASGVGVDPDGEALARARAAGVDAELIEARAQDAGLREGAFDLVVNVAASHAHGGFPDALRELRALARPHGGLVLFGEGFWAREPSPAFLDALGGATADELPLGLDALLDAARAAGLAPVAPPRVASAADWAAYEDGLAAEAERYDDAEARDYAARIRARHALPYGRDTFGFALLVLQR